MDRNATAVVNRGNELRTFWEPRNTKMQSWYRLIQMIDELKTEKMESFVGNDPRSLYNLVLHMLDVPIPHRVEQEDLTDIELSNAIASVGKFFNTAWSDVSNSFRRSNPRQSLNRTRLGFLLATGWYSEFSIVSDSGERCLLDVWNPAETFPMWDGDIGLSEVAHIFKIGVGHARGLAARNGWSNLVNGTRFRPTGGRHLDVYDYWWMEVMDTFPFTHIVWNAIVVDGILVKFDQTRFKKMPIYTAPVGGLPDMGALTEGMGVATYQSTYKLQSAPHTDTDRWKAELGQSIVATNENIYRTWNKWWTFALQLMRDTAQPRVFERSRSGKAIVRPEDIFRRGAIFRGGPDDSVDYLSPPPMPLELRSTQLDLEAMMQRGGVSWAMFGSMQGQVTAFVMSQIAASANQIMRPFHQAFINLNEDEDNDWLQDIRDRGVKPYGFTWPEIIPEHSRVSADYDIEIPGDLVQRATTARMLDPDFRLSYTYVVKKLFPDIKDPLRERAMVRSDQAEMHPSNAVIALVQYYRRQANYLEGIGDSESAKLYELAAESTLAQMAGPEAEQPLPGGPRQIGNRIENVPQIPERIPGQAA